MIDLERYGSCTLDQDGCTVCGDQAVPVRVLAVAQQTALCEDRQGRRAHIAIDFVPGVQRGMVLLVHMGIALTCIDEEAG